MGVIEIKYFLYSEILATAFVFIVALFYVGTNSKRENFYEKLFNIATYNWCVFTIILGIVFLVYNMGWFLI